jgi:hypothetical protein
VFPVFKAVAKKGITCSACKKPITGKYIGIGEYKFHTECLKCSYCGKPLNNSIFGQGPEFYHDDCYKKTRGLTCAMCSGILRDRWAEFEGKKYHPDCYKKHVQLTCTVCGKPIEGDYTKTSEGTFHASCFRETKLERCAVCSLPLDGRFLIDDWGNHAHETHNNKPTPFCNSCNRIISEKTSNGGFLYNDGRNICGICVLTAITEPDQIKKARTKVLKILSDKGLDNIPDTLPIRLVDRNTLLKKAKNHSSKNTKGFTSTTIKTMAGMTVSMNHTVYILAGLPGLEFEGVLAHELLHVWLAENRISMQEPFTEGFCNLGVMLVNQSDKSTFSDVIQNHLEQNPDPVYGDGYRLMKKKLDENSWEILIRELHNLKR